METITRKEAKALGLARYFTGKSCPHGHVVEKLTTSKRCVQCNRDRVARWQANNPDKVAAQRKRTARSRNESTKRSKLKNPAKYKALRVAWLEKNKERAKRIVTLAKAKKPEKYRALHLAWEHKNKHKVAAWSKSAGARRRGATSGKFNHGDVRDILEDQRFKCAYFGICGTRLREGAKQHVDHILAISRGGSNDRSNLQILCPTCNLRKSARDAMEFTRSHGLLL